MTEDVDIHAVTGALKLYLRELPIPLISFEVFEQLLITLDGTFVHYNCIYRVQVAIYVL